MKHKLPLICILASLNFFTSTLLSFAQGTGDQSANLAILNSYNISVPTTLTLPSTFVSDTEDIILYRSFNPSSEDDQIRVSSISNRGFSVSFNVENFENSTTADTIPYSNLGFVTLASAAGESVDSNPSNYPSGSDTVMSNFDCDVDNPNNSNQKFNEYCETDGPGFTTFTGSTSVSTPQTIMTANDPVTYRSGEYSMALGLKITIPQGTPAGDYSSAFTFTLIPNP